jgi:hypothetical protein
VHHAEFGAGRIALRIGFDDQRYEVTLLPAPDRPSAWRGAWMREGHSSSGAVSARVYRANDGGFALIGDWSEDGTVYCWGAEFEASR